MDDHNKPLVSICMITYNHEPYIIQSITSIIEQKCNFDFELVIGEDFSTDNTRKICEEFATRYSQIRLLPTNVNLGVMPNFIRTLKSCKGKYIALCEGDDYWTNPSKLQKQVNFLEANCEFSLCFHDAVVIHDDKSKEAYNFCENLGKSTFNIKDVIKSWFIPTASIVFHKDKLFPIPSWMSKIYNGDYSLQLLLALKGDFYFIKDVMCVYRKNSIGSLSSTYSNYKIYVKQLQLLNYFNRHTNYKYMYYICRKIIYILIVSGIAFFKSLIIRLPVVNFIWIKLAHYYQSNIKSL